MSETGSQAPTDDRPTHSGFVAVVGAPNAGKSTLINTLVGSKVSIVSPKVQTTRTLVRGIMIHDRTQIVFIDTPGLFDPKKRLEEAMVGAAYQSMKDADLILLIYDSTRPRPDKKTQEFLKELADGTIHKPCALALNKTDKVHPPDLLKLAQSFNEQYEFAATFMVSAQKGRGTDDILPFLAQSLPEGPWYYPKDQISDMPLRLLAAEITREKLFYRLRAELPYGLTVETESWEERDDGSVFIRQVIMIARDTHKGIVLGKGGRQIKEIGTAARLELEEITGQKVHLKLFVKVSPRWQDDPAHYAAWGLDYSR